MRERVKTSKTSKFMLLTNDLTSCIIDKSNLDWGVLTNLQQNKAFHKSKSLGPCTYLGKVKKHQRSILTGNSMIICQY
jgi:hypothetical protein